METSFGNLLVVVLIAFTAPIVVATLPRLTLPAVVLEIVAGIVAGPHVLGLVAIDEPLNTVALLGLAFLLFLAGLEVDFDRLRGPIVRAAATGFALSFAVGVAVGTLLRVTGVVQDALFTATVLAATSLGVVIPVIKDAGAGASPLGQLVIAAASIADFGAVVLLTALFSMESASTAAQLSMLGAFAVAAVLVALALRGLAHFGAFSRLLTRLQDTTAQIRVRGAFLLVIAFVALASQAGLETILGAFAAGLALSFADRDPDGGHPRFRAKLEGAGYGFFIPVFFVTVGVRFDLRAVLDEPSTLAAIPVFLAALLAVRGAPAWRYRHALGARLAVAAALLQATSLPFIVAATSVGRELGVVASGTAASLVGAGVLSVVAFPPLAAALLNTAEIAKPADALSRCQVPR